MTDIFLPGYAVPLLTMSGIGFAGVIYGVWMVRQMQKELAETEAEERAAKAALTPAE